MTAEPPPRSGRSRGALGVVYGTVFLDLLGFGIILPSLPYYAHQLGASGAALGVLFAAYSIAQLVGAATLGRLSDRIGRRPILLLSLAGSCAAMALSAVATQLLLLTIARALAGLFGGSISTAQAYIADVTARQERARYMGLLGASIGVGFVIGPALGALLISLGFGFPGAALTAAVLAGVNLLLGLLLLPEPPRRSGRRPLPSLRRWAASLGRTELRGVLAATFASTFAFVGMETTFAYFGEARFGMTSRKFGFVLVFVGVIVIVVQGGLIGRLSRRFGEQPVAVVGMGTLAMALALIPFAPTLGVVLVPMGLLAAGQGLSTPTLATLLSHAAEQDEQGATLGLGQSLSALARAVGPLVAGALYDLHVAAPYLFGSAVVLFAASLLRSRPADNSHQPVE